MSDTIPPLTVDELQTALAEATRERDKLLEENRKLRAAVNRWQGLAQSALGNVAKVAGEIQVYLRDGTLPE